MGEPLQAQELTTERLAWLCDLVKEHRCRSDGAMRVDQCVETGRCGCSVGIIIRAVEKTD